MPFEATCIQAIIFLVTVNPKEPNLSPNFVLFSTMLPSVPQAKLWLLNFRDAQKAKFSDSSLSPLQISCASLARALSFLFFGNL